MAKDALGHGSDARGGNPESSFTPHPKGTRFVKGTLATREEMAQQYPDMNFAKSATYTPGAVAHQAGVNSVGGKTQITIFHQDGEYAVPIPGNKGHSFTDGKADAEATARAMHGPNITIKHRAKSWGPEMD